MKILLKTALSPYSGYGNDGIQLTRTLRKMTSDLALMPNVVQAPLPLDVASTLTHSVAAPFDLSLVHQDPMTMEATEELKRSSKCLVGWTMWEWSSFKAMEGRSTLRKRLSWFDAVVAYDTVTADALSDYYRGPIIVQQGGYDPEMWPAQEREWHGDEFYFGQIGVLSVRKDPFVSIKAFAAAQAQDPEFAKHARLMLKTTSPGLHSKIEDVFPNVRVFYDTWTQEQVREFYGALHVLVAPSRGEGKNLPALESMSTGIPNIATSWGGHTMWQHPHYSYGLDYTLVADDPAKPEVLNARASQEDLTAKMLHVFHNRSEAKQKGETASRVIPEMCSWDSVVRRLLTELQRLGFTVPYPDLEALRA